MTRPAATRATSCGERRSRRRSPLQAALPALLSLVAILAALLLLPAVALGHAQLVSLDPADGAVLPSSPAAVVLTFNEPIGLAPGGLRVLDGTGGVVDAGDDVVDGPAITQALPPLPDGWYVVTWGVVSEDGHVVRASSVFGVGDADAAARPRAPDEAASPLAGPARLLGDLGLLVAAGAWAAWWFLGARIRSVLRLAWGAAAVALAGTALWAWLEYQDGGSAWMATQAATLTIVRLALLTIALVPAGASAFIPSASAGLALLTLSGGGHSAGDAWSMVLLAVHLAAAAVWLGATPAVLLALRDPGLDDTAATGVVRRFSSLAAFAVAVVVAAGLALTWNLSDALAGGLTMPWLLLIGGKLVLVAVALGLGAWGRRHLRGTTDRARLRRLFLVDAALLLLVAGLSAALTLNSPHVGHATHPGHAAGGSSRCALTAGGASLSVVLQPGRVGSNTVLIGGVPDGAQSVTIGFVHALTEGGALTLAAQPAADGWTASGALPLAGSWEATVRVRVDTFTQVEGSCRLRVEP